MESYETAIFMDPTWLIEYWQFICCNLIALPKQLVACMSFSHVTLWVFWRSCLDLNVASIFTVCYGIWYKVNNGNRVPPLMLWSPAASISYNAHRLHLITSYPPLTASLAHASFMEMPTTPPSSPATTSEPAVLLPTPCQNRISFFNLQSIYVFLCVFRIT